MMLWVDRGALECTNRRMGVQPCPRVCTNGDRGPLPIEENGQKVDMEGPRELRAHISSKTNPWCVN